MYSNWNFSNSKLLIVFILMIVLDMLIAKIHKNPKIFYIEHSKINYDAQTLPPIGIFILKEYTQNKMLRDHELIHWKQYRRMGAILFYLKYITEYLLFGYDKHPMEIEARIKTGEKEECIKNMTNCIRSGKAKTVFNKEFRK